MKFVARLGVLAGLSLVAACGPSMGPKVRVATATAAQLQAVENEDNVWYEFEAGDLIPIQLGFLGVVEGGSKSAGFRAKQHFYFVMFKNAPMQVSFDGKTFAGQHGSQSLIGVIPREDGKGGQLAWFIYMGESGDPRAELAKVIEESKQAEAPASEPAPAPEPAP
ncbi:MAG: hypothetical protein ABUL60_03420 [Myxococcales bacterium]